MEIGEGESSHLDEYLQALEHVEMTEGDGTAGAIVAVAVVIPTEDTQG